MSGALTVLTSQTLDRSATFDPVLLSAATVLTVQRDAGTPAGDPVNVTLAGVSALALSTILVQDGADVSVDSLAGVVAAAGLDIGPGGTLTLLPSVGVSVAAPITFTGPGGTLVLDQSAPTLSLLGGVSGFTASDTVDFRGVSAATSASIQGGVLTLYNGAAAVASLAIANDTASNTTLSVAADGSGGIDVGDNLANVTERFSGNSSQYTIAVNTAYQGYVRDNVPNLDGTTIPANGTTIGFSNGTAFIDPSGNSEAIARLYQSVLGRMPDAGGEAGFSSLVDQSSMTLSQVAGAIVNSQEFQQKFGALTGTQFVDQLYQNVGAAPDANAPSLIASLSGGASTAQVALTFSNQYAAVQSTLPYSGDASESEVYRLYQTVLDRAPDLGGLTAYVNASAAGLSSASIAQDFVGSAEFAGKYGGLSNSALVNQLYENGLGRAADPAGLSFWTNQLNAGGSAAGVALGIADSLEARLDTASATHDGWVFLGQST